MARNGGSHVEPRRLLKTATRVHRDLGRALAQLEEAQVPDRLGRFVVEPGEPLDAHELAAFLRACHHGHEGLRLVVTVTAREA